MPYKKRIHEKVHNLPEEFLNNFDGYLVHEKIGDMYPHLQLNNDRVLRLEDVKKIELWHRNNNLQGFFLDWEHVIIPLCRVLRVPMKKRSELYSKYRESKKRKLELAIKKHDNVRKYIDKITIKPEYKEVGDTNPESFDPSLLDVKWFVEDKINYYEDQYKKLEDKHTSKAGKMKFVLPILKPIFEKLSTFDLLKNEQMNIVCKLLKTLSPSEFKKKDITDVWGYYYKLYPKSPK